MYVIDRDFRKRKKMPWLIQDTIECLAKASSIIDTDSLFSKADITVSTVSKRKEVVNVVSHNPYCNCKPLL